MDHRLHAESSSPFHAGEIQVQSRLGVRQVETWARRVIRDHMPDQHRDFYAQQPFLILAARDAAGRPWATLIEGEPGFVTSPNPRALDIHGALAAGDALDGALGVESDVGILGIEFATRRRNRVNGHLSGTGNGILSFTVDQSFGNCPQYIHERDYTFTPETPVPHKTVTASLTATQAGWIRAADTFFLATGYRGDGAHESYGMDASHRGGNPGFVEVPDEATLRFPDYAGNNHFNTIGNLMLDDRIGMLFVDFASGSLLQVSGRATIDWTSDTAAQPTEALRYISVHIDEVVELRSALRLRWRTASEDMSTLQLVAKTAESADVTSFTLAAADGDDLPSFKAGQYLPIAIEIPGHAGPAHRTYSLSHGPDQATYRISVKREDNGLVSRHLHDHLEVGMHIRAGRPSGDLTIPDEKAPLVLVSAGVGITPMLSILHDTGKEAGQRPVWFVHGARNGMHHPHANEVRSLAEATPHIRTLTAYSHPLDTDQRGTDYDTQGRIDVAALMQLQLPTDAHFLLCGPAAFMSDIEAGLTQASVPEYRIHQESFG
jgi:ferredoxin-NADP reductase/predicted pyridoxine 5'-phosphate oxidase superfamily flavin-nucleotide-binding protein